MNCFKHTLRSQSPLKIAGMVVLGIIAFIGFAALFGFITMWLWNALVPTIFGLGTITYWQAVGLLILAKIFFGGFGSGGGGKSKKHHHKSEKGGKNDFSKWALYDEFWKEEGDAAYQDFIKRKNEPSTPSEGQNE